MDVIHFTWCRKALCPLKEWSNRGNGSSIKEDYGPFPRLFRSAEQPFVQFDRLLNPTTGSIDAPHSFPVKRLGLSPIVSKKTSPHTDYPCDPTPTIPPKPKQRRRNITAGSSHPWLRENRWLLQERHGTSDSRSGVFRFLKMGG